MKLLAVPLIFLAGCAASVPSARDTPEPAPLSRQQAHQRCYQQMQAARAGAFLTTPDWHQYRMCMRARGFEAAAAPVDRSVASAESAIDGLRPRDR